MARIESRWPEVISIRQPLRTATVASLVVLASLRPAWAQVELIANGGFESGSTGWTMSGGAGVYSDGGLSRSGAYYLWLGGVENENDAAYQTITIPGGVASATLSFYYNIYSEEDTSIAYDTFTVTIRNTSGAVLATVGNWSNINQDPAPGNPYYHQKTFSLLPYAGQTIRVQFASVNDSSLVTSFRVDDVSVQVPSLPPPGNDSCSGALSMTAGTTYTLNTATATPTNDPTPTCEGTFGKGVWYSFTPSASGTVTISTCGSDFDTALAVYTGSCGSLTEIACNDDSGPACATSQASVSFSGTAGTTYRILAGGHGGASGNLSILATSTGIGGLQIIPTFDSSITSDPQAATIEATINSALAVYQSTFSDPITVSIKFQKMAGGLGQSGSYYQTVSYSSYRAALVTHATTADDANALAHLPNTAANPVNGNTSVRVHLPLMRALGFSNANPPAGEPDGTVYLNTSIMNLSPFNTDANKFSLFAAASHEIDEVLGFDSALNGLNNGDPAPTGAVTPEDLFRYDVSGARSLTTASNAASYFSLDGTTDLARFNQYQGGDFQDWYSYYGGQTPEIQDAFAVRGSFPVLGVELTALDVIGYTRIASTVRPTLSLRRSGGNVILTWPSSYSGFTLQSASNLVPVISWATNSPSPVIVNGLYTVTNASTSGKKFYRLVK
jgi:hypothetical protein